MTYNRALWLTYLTLGQRVPQSMATPPLKRAVVVAWCGMRGIVTLAVALALPDGSSGAPAFPYRDLIVLTAFTVVFGTLVIQGLTLRPLVLALGLDALGLDDDQPIEDETRVGRQEMLKAALESVGRARHPSGRVAASRIVGASGRVDGSGGPSPQARRTENALRARARAASRERLDHLRLTGLIGDAVFHQLEAELDLIELGTQVRSRW